MRPDLHLDSVLGFKYVRSVANDNTVRFDDSTIQLLADEHRASYARAKVEVQERLDGTIVVAYQGRTLASVPAPPGPVTLRARSSSRPNGLSPSDLHGDRANGPHTRPVGAERRNGAKGIPGVEPRPTIKTNSPRKPAPDHPWRRPLLT